MEFTINQNAMASLASEDMLKEIAFDDTLSKSQSNNENNRTRDLSMIKAKKFKGSTIEQAVSKVGGMGRFQYIAFTIIEIGFLSATFVILNVNLFTAFPVYMCPNSSTGQNETCTTADICNGADTPQITYYVNYSDVTSLNNWIEQFSLTCATSS